MQSGHRRPSYDELAALVGQLAAEGAAKDAVFAELRAEVAELPD